MTDFKKFFAIILQLKRIGEQSTETSPAETGNIERDYQRAISAGSIEALEGFLHEHPLEQHPDSESYYKRAMSALNDYAVSPRRSAPKQAVLSAGVGENDVTKGAVPAKSAAAVPRRDAETIRTRR